MKRILLVDDDPAVTALIASRLSRQFEVHSVHDPRQAVRVAASIAPDVIFCDVDMPDMNGGEVAVALAANAQTAAIPLVYLTALVTPEEIPDIGGMVSGRPALSKRAPLAELVRAIEKACGGS